MNKQMKKTDELQRMFGEMEAVRGWHRKAFERLLFSCPHQTVDSLIREAFNGKHDHILVELREEEEPF